MWRNFAIAQECYDPLTSEDQKTTEKPRQRCLEDTTIEAAQEVLKNSPDGVPCFQDELSRRFGSLEKYGGRGASANRGFSYALNRIKRGA